MGFGHIRLPVDPQAMMNQEDGSLNEEMTAALEKAIVRINAADLAVIVDAHPKMPDFKELSRKTELREAFITWWGLMARRLSGTDPELVFLETLNEPGGQKFWAEQEWWDYQDKLFTAMRKGAPDHTLIGNAGAYMLHHELPRYTPHTDRNIVYSVHYYEPRQFTHQGAVWTKDWYQPLRHVPWPLTEDNLEEALKKLDREGKNAERAEGSVKALKDCVADGLGLPRNIETNLGRVAEWAKKHERRMFIGEFGVLETYCSPEDRVAWIDAVRKACEANGFGWSMWQYCGNFVLMKGENEPGKRVADPKIIKALGL